jgi:hypothetical protein
VRTAETLHVKKLDEDFFTENEQQRLGAQTSANNPAGMNGVSVPYANTSACRSSECIDPGGGVSTNTS